MKPIVVGIDGSEGSRAALRWAGAEAHLRHTPVLALAAWHYDYIPLPTGDSMPTQPWAATGVDALKWINDSVEACREQLRGLELETRVDEGRPAPVLLAAAERAILLVVGARGHGGFLGLRLGSVSTQVSHHAACPVVIVPAAWGRPGT